MNEIQYRIHHQPLSHVGQRSRAEGAPPERAGKDQLEGDRLLVLCLSAGFGNGITIQ